MYLVVFLPHSFPLAWFPHFVFLFLTQWSSTHYIHTVILFWRPFHCFPTKLNLWIPQSLFITFFLIGLGASLVISAISLLSFSYCTTQKDDVISTRHSRSSTYSIQDAEAAKPHNRDFPGLQGESG